MKNIVLGFVAVLLAVCGFACYAVPEKPAPVMGTVTEVPIPEVMAAKLAAEQTPTPAKRPVAAVPAPLPTKRAPQRSVLKQTAPPAQRLPAPLPHYAPQSQPQYRWTPPRPTYYQPRPFRARFHRFR